MSFPSLKKLLKLPCGQQRTAKYKQFVVILDNEYVAKGPYKSVRKILKRSQAMLELGTPLVVHPVRTEVNDEGKWLIFPNLLQGSKFTTRKITERISSHSYNILDETPLIPFNHVPREPDYASVDLLLSLIHLFMIGVGDSTLRNILVHTRKKTVHVTDYDEDSDSVSYGPMFYFKKPAGKEHEWLKRVKPFYGEVLSRLEEQGDSDHFLTGRYNIAVSIIHALVHDNYGIYNGPFNSSTASGHSFDVMKSALQKYVRRGNERALNVFSEMWSLGYLNDGILTNVYNRISIIAVEDIGLSNPALVELAVNVRGKSFSYCYALLQEMIKSTKTRVASHIWYCYSRPLVLEDYPSPTTKLTPKEKRWLGRRPKIDIIEYYLTKKNLKVFTWIYYASTLGKISPIKKCTSVTSRIGTTTDAMGYVWRILFMFLPEDIIRMLETSYYSFSNSKRVFVVHAALMVLYPQEYEVAELRNKIESSEEDEGVHIPISKKLQLHRYVVDKHTKEGREKGMSTTEFVTEGAIVRNEDPLYIFEELKFHYTNREED